MLNQKDEFHHCPCCHRRTRHRVSRERKLAPVLWCQGCFHVHVQATEADPYPAAAVAVVPARAMTGAPPS